jgi:predicted nuclease of restriction endonuclease-like (RecB) superfamily
MSSNEINIYSQPEDLFSELSKIIDESQKQVTVYANSTLVGLYWQVGHRMNKHILQNKRAEYGKEIVSTLSTKLKEKYGRSFEERNLRRMMQFAEQFSDIHIIEALAQKLSWSHFIELLPLKTMEAKLFYAQNSVQQGLGIRALRKQIATKTFERTAIVNIKLTPNSDIPLNTFKDPYLLDFLGLKDGFLEKDIEQAILKELEQFILEIGKGFSFIERQKRMIIDGEDYYLDLLFFHRKLKRLIAIDLKIGKFHAKDKGQMELYLKWLNRYERQAGEEKPIGLILCAESSREQVELLEMDKDGIVVAEYWTELPPKHLLEERLHKALIEASERIERNKLNS